MAIDQKNSFVLSSSGKQTTMKQHGIQPPVQLDDLIFGGWATCPDNVYALAVAVNVLNPALLYASRTERKAIPPMKVAFDKRYVKNRVGTHIKQTTMFQLK